MKKMIEELENIPNISRVCEKVGISRQTFFRWKNEDKEFKKKIEESLSIGTDYINDLCENKLYSMINAGEFRAIKYHLDNRKKEYIKPRDKNFWNELNKEENNISKIIIVTKNSKGDEIPIVDFSGYEKDDEKPFEK